MPDESRTLAHIPDILHAERQVEQAEAYLWDNRRRSPPGTLVVQRTLAGAGWYADRGGRLGVRAGQAMLFAYGEASRYGIGGPEDRPYALEYAVLRPAGGIRELTAQIRGDFGSVVRMAEQGEAAHQLGEIVELFRSGRARDRLDMAERAYRLLLAIYREQVTGIESSDPVAYLRHLLQSQFRSPKNLKQWLHGRGLSREHFTRTFHARYGETPGAFLRRLRLTHARLLARGSSLPVEDIAAASGFACSQTLRRAFRREFGETLGQARGRPT